MDADSSGGITSMARELRPYAIAVLVALTVFLAIGAWSTLKSIRYIGSGIAASNTITVSGEGEVFAVPDTATFSVTVMETAKDVTTAQTAATKKSNDIVAYLKTEGIEDKDVQTTDYSVQPQYEWVRVPCTADGFCADGRQNLTGYAVSQTITVKVRETEAAGTLLSGVGSKGASSVSGLQFTIDDQDALEAEARDEAIADAEAKAKALAKSLGVRLARVVGFSENGSYPPIYYGKEMAVQSMAADGRGGAPAPDLPVGQNKIYSAVSVTYEIR